MATTAETRHHLSDARFELDALDLDGDRLVLTGRWHNVRGLRFVRPTLLAGERSVLATLDDKPWAPDSTLWRATFPWDESSPRPDDLVLAVAPSVTVPVGDVMPADATAPPAPMSSATVARSAPAEGPDTSARREREAAERDLDRLRAQLDEAVEARDAAMRSRRRMAEELERERAARRAAEDLAARERDTLDAATGRHSALESRLATAHAERDAAVRARDDLEARAAAARAEAEEARREAAHADGERERIRGHRDEVLAAHHALDRQVIELQGQLHDGRPPRSRGRSAPEPARGYHDLPQAAAPDASPGRDDETGPDDVEGTHDGDPVAHPIGVRRIPAVRATARDLLKPDTERRVVTELDMWLVRILGSVAAICFIALLFMVVRVMA